jgi:cyanophycinase
MCEDWMLAPADVPPTTAPRSCASTIASPSVVPQPAAIDPEDAAELAEAQHDMRQLARDIAAADASPAALRRRLARTRTKIGPNPDPLEGPVS